MELLVFGAGYCGLAVARAAAAAGVAVTATLRAPRALPAGVRGVPFDAAAAALARATHVLATAPPGAAGDPVLARHDLASAPLLRWAGYLSTTGVYGDRGGGWVDEATPPAPASPRARLRVAAEQGWAALAGRAAVDLFRVAGIYGPGRSAFDDLRDGTARRVDRPGHAFARIHRDDVAGAVLAAMRQDRPAGVRVLHLADDLPAESAAVVAEAARLRGVPLPPLVPFAQAWAAMSPMARSFWAEHRRVASATTQAALGYRWRYPDYRAGLAAILAEQGGDGAAQQGDVGVA